MLSNVSTRNADLAFTRSWMTWSQASLPLHRADSLTACAMRRMAMRRKRVPAERAL